MAQSACAGPCGGCAGGFEITVGSRSYEGRAAFPRGALTDCAVAVLGCGNAERKADLSRKVFDAWRAGAVKAAAGDGPPRLPKRPARPDRPLLRPPREMPKRALSSTAGRVALLHALAHIELNAIDLAWDMIGRFGHEIDETAFFDDWARVGGEEGQHFHLLDARLRELGSHYGALDAHDGLWQAAEDTAHDVMGRLAVVPLVLEARGLDVSPGMIERLRTVGDDQSAEILQRIYDDEIGHVAVGMRWFVHVAHCRGHNPEKAFHICVRQYFRGRLKPPFNHAARRRAGLLPAFYGPLTS